MQLNNVTDDTSITVIKNSENPLWLYAASHGRGLKIILTTSGVISFLACLFIALPLLICLFDILHFSLSARISRSNCFNSLLKSHKFRLTANDCWDLKGINVMESTLNWCPFYALIK